MKAQWERRETLMTTAFQVRQLRRNGVEIRLAPENSHTQYYLTASADGSKSGWDSAEDIFSELAATLEKYGIRPIQEQIYGLRSARKDLLAIREKALAAHRIEPALPFAYIEGRPVGRGDWRGVQVWGVGPGSTKRPPEVVTVDCPGRRRGRLWSAQGFKLLYIPSITGSERNASEPSGAAPLQAERMFSNARTALRAHGFSYCNVARTWIYIRRLLDWYGDLNKVRNALYRDREFFGAPAAEDAFPASTGIQGRCGEEECVMNLLAVDVDGTRQDLLPRPILHTARQGQAFAYRSAFSRAMALRMGDVETIYISGTASINSAGESVYPGDREGQTLQMLLSIASLLEEQGGGLENICTATLYCANREVFETYRRMARLLRLPAFPTIAVLADVCRPELLIEMEATAAVSRRT